MSADRNPGWNKCTWMYSSRVSFRGGGAFASPWKALAPPWKSSNVYYDCCCPIKNSVRPVLPPPCDIFWMKPCQGNILCTCVHSLMYTHTLLYNWNWNAHCEDRLFIGCFIHMYVHGMSSGTGVEFGTCIINIDGKKIKVQIWDTVSETEVTPWIS